MKKSLMYHLIVVAALLALAYFPMAELLADRDAVFAFNDGNIEMSLSPANVFPHSFVGRWDNQFFMGSGIGASPITSPELLEGTLSPSGYRRTGVLLSILVAALAGYWCCLQMGRSRLASTAAALLLLLCGWNYTFPTAGLTARPLALAWSLLSLGMLERARKNNSFVAYLCAGGFLGLAVTDAPDIGILFAATCAVYFFVTHLPKRDQWTRALAVRSGLAFVLYVAMSLFVAYQVVNSMTKTNITGVTQGIEQSAEARYEWATQWSMPKAETWSLIAPDFHGASSRSQESPYWGGMGRSAEWDGQRQGFRNFRLAGYAVGAIPFMLTGLLLVYLFQRRAPEILLPHDRRIAWVSLFFAVVGLMLSWGKHFPLYRVFYALPFMDTIRNPDKWLGPFTLGLALTVAIGVDLLARLYQSDDQNYRRKLALWAGALCAVIPLIGIFSLAGLNLAKGAFVQTLKSQGFDEMTEVAWQNAKSADAQVIVVSILAMGIMFVPALLKRKNSRVLSVSCIALLMLIMSIDLARAISPFVISHDYKHILRKNPMTKFFDEHVDQGRIKILPANMPLLNNWRLTYLAAGGYDLFDPVSVSRMPSDYQALFSALQSNPRRLWELGAIRYFVCPLNVVPQLQGLYPNSETIVPRLAFGVTVSGQAYVPDTSVPQNQRALAIVENTAALPMTHLVANWSSVPDGTEGLDLALERLASPAFDPHKEAIVHGQAPSLAPRNAPADSHAQSRSDRATRAVVNVSCKEDLLLVRSVKYDPDWQVTVDGKDAELRRVNYMLQGVFIPANTKEVVFTYQPPLRFLYVAIGSRALLLALIGLLVVQAFRARRRAELIPTPSHAAS